MKRILRFLLCVVLSFIIVYLSGYENLMNHISPSLATVTFIGAVIVVSIFAFLLLEVYLMFKWRINDLSKRIDELEQDIKENK